MGATPESASSRFKERKYRRFDLQFPVSMSFAVAGAAREVEAVSKNVSIGGLLLKAGDQVPLQTQVSLVLNVVAASSGRMVRLLGEGEVVRVDPMAAGVGFEIAVACKQPISEMEDAFSVAG